MRAKKKRRDTKRLARWRAKKELLNAQGTQPADQAAAAQPRS